MLWEADPASVPLEMRERGVRCPPLPSGTVTQASSSSHNDEDKGGLAIERAMYAASST